jgi:hypothetical protein
MMVIVTHVSAPENYGMAGSSHSVKSSQTAKAQNTKRDEVLKRMLKMKPQPHAKPKTDCLSQQLNITDSEENVSHGNKKR